MITGKEFTKLKSFLKINLIRLICFVRAIYGFPFNKKTGLIDSESLGVLILCLEKYLVYVKKNSIKDYLIYCKSSNHCNSLLFSLYSKNLNIKIDPKKYSILLNGGWKFRKIFGLQLETYDTTTMPFSAYYPPTSSREITLGNKEYEVDRLLEKIGLEKGKFITFHARNNCYWNSINPKEQEIRNSKDSDFEAVLYKQMQSGVKVVRIGEYDERLPNLIYLNDFERSFRERCELIASKFCKFSISGSSGVALYPYIFGNKVLIHNFAPYGGIDPIDNSIILLKKFYYDGKMLSLSQLSNFKTPYGMQVFNNRLLVRPRKLNLFYVRDSILFNNLGIEIEDNSSDELECGVNEIDSNIGYGEEFLTDEDRYLQRKFRSYFPDEASTKNFIGIISPYFLNKYKDQLLC